MSIDKYQQSMENWKKEIIIDPHLNALFDSEITAEDFLNTKILTLPHQDIVKAYMKLTSLKHAITKNMQKEIEVRHVKIEHSFQECLKSKTAYEEINQDNIKDSLKQIQKFNQKYQLIFGRITQIRNINKILHFAKALQKFKVNARLLKSLMKDFDQSANVHLQSELLNTLKISKIIKEISAITIKFDFSGIKSYEEERVFLNNTKGGIYGLIEKELTVVLSKIPHHESHKRLELEKDIINKFIILNNIVKLREFCILFYKNILNEVSQLLKKSLVIGQSVDERDPKNYLQVFQQYFTNSLRRKLVENGIIFIMLEQLLGRSNIKATFNCNFFQKYWENITVFMKDLISWSIDIDGKECSKQKLSQSLYESFYILDSKNYISKYLTSIVWKYPVIYQALISISNEIHLYIIKHTEVHHYQFPLLKQTFLRVLVPLAQLYYKHVNIFFSIWKAKVNRIKVKFQSEEEITQNFLLARCVQLFEESKSSKSNESLGQILRIIDWLIFNLKTKQIYQFYIDQLLSITDEYFKIFSETVNRYDSEKHNKDNFIYFLNKYQEFVEKIKTVLKRGKVSEQNRFQSQLKRISNTKGVLASTSQKLIILIQKCRYYDTLLAEGKLKCS